MKKEIIVATKNIGKVIEFEQLFVTTGWTVRSLLDYPQIPNIVEDGQTFTENARKKAETIAHVLGKMVIADDSGLVIDALDGRPGVYSARYAGMDNSDVANNEKVLRELSHVSLENRTAYFICVIAVARPGQETLFYEGRCSGLIVDEAVGFNGFGYDPIFLLPDLNQTMAQVSSEEKNKRSHRFKALSNFFESETEWGV